MVATPTSTSALTSGPHGSRLPAAAAVVAGALALTGLTWLWVGYRWLAWPQPGFIDHVLRYDGELVGDWHTSLPPVHWAMAHVYGWLPFGVLETAVTISWVLSLVALWVSFILLAQGLGADRWSALAAGAVAVTTGFSGVGSSTAILNVFYPPAVSFVFVLGAVAALVWRRPVFAAALLGVATLAHSNQGALATLACALPLVALLGRDWMRWVWAGIAYGVFGLPSVLQAAFGQSTGGALTDQERYDIIAIVRQPHHVLFDSFTAAEYIQTLGWTAVLAVAAFTVLQGVLRRTILLLGGSIMALLAVGALAGELERPVLVVLLQTSRLSALLVALGVAAAAVLVHALVGRWAPAVLLAVMVGAVYADRWWDRLAPHVAPDKGSWLTVSGAAAIGVLLACALARALRGRVPALRPALASGAAAALVIVALIVVVAQRDGRVSTTPPVQLAYEDVADHAREASASGTTVLTPPDMDGFRDLARRPVIVEFGTIRYGDGDHEWLERMGAVTGGVDLLSVEPYGKDVAARLAAIAAAYDTAAVDPDAACRYGAMLVVTRSSAPEPPWAQTIYDNGTFRLGRRNPDACG